VTTKRLPCGIREGNIFGLNNLYKLAGIDINDLSQTRPWTRDCREHLVELYKQGWTINEIAEELNRTPGNVVGELYDLGEAGKVSFGMWGSKSKNGQRAESGQFRLFIVKKKREVETDDETVTTPK
jgi:hypothetical protein